MSQGTSEKPYGGRPVVWSGAVAFGLVSIPVSAVPAAREARVPFHLLHDEDHARLERRMVCPEDGRVVPFEHMTRGFEVEPGRYVVVREDELEALEPRRSRTMEITDFVPAASIDPIYYDRPYYLVPDGPARPYRVLAEALAETDTAGLAKFVMHSREHLAALRGMEGALCLFTLHFAETLVEAEAPERAAPPASGDVRAVEDIMRRMTRPWDPARYRNAWRERVLTLIRGKERAGGAVEAPAAGGREPDLEPADLAAALEEAIARVRRGAHR